MSKHTPEPWKIDDDEITGGIDYIATLAYSTCEEEQKKVNALLIAAAPDLLAACEAAYASLGFPIDDESLNRVTNMLANALAKARRGWPVAAADAGEGKE